MSPNEDPLVVLFAETATTARDPAFAARVRLALLPRRRAPSIAFSVLVRSLAIAAAVGGVGLAAGLVMRAAPYAAFVLALGAVAAALKISRGRNLV